MVTSPLAWDESSSQAHFLEIGQKGNLFSLYLILMLRMNQKSGK